MVGVGFTKKMIGPHYSGNFWWSKGSYFNTLPKNADGSLNIGSGYLDPENFIFKGKNANHIDIDEGRAPHPDTDYYSFKPGIRAANRTSHKVDQQNNQTGGKSKRRNIKRGGTKPNVAERIDNVALLIPIYPPHFPALYGILKKLKDNTINIDVYVIFSTKEEYDKFAMKDSVKHIIINYVPNQRIKVEKTESGYVMFKKLYGLHYMIGSPYEYIILCDSEMDILPENFTKENVLSKIERFYSNKMLSGVNAERYGVTMKIIRTCADQFVGEDHAKIKDATQDFRLYSFWFDIPVYKTAYLQEFLDKIQYSTMMFTWHTFEHVLYNYYLIACQGFKVVDITDFVDNEYTISNGIYVHNSKRMNMLKYVGVGFGFTLAKFWKDKRELLEAERPFLLCHTDRLNRELKK